ncbi:N-acetyltransferase family protein [Corynebacterium camporealensis]
MTALSIRRAGVEDAEALVALSKETFTETFGHLYAPEDLASFLESAYDLGKHKRLLADADYAVWLLELGDNTVGYVLAGPCSLPYEKVQETDGEIKRLYILSDYQAGGYGARLMNTALGWLGEKTIWLGVWSENYGAQRFYNRYGFSKVGECYFEVGEHRDLEFIFRKDS